MDCIEKFNGYKSYTTLLSYGKKIGAIDASGATYVIQANCADNKWRRVTELKEKDVIFTPEKRIIRGGVELVKLVKKKKRFFTFNDVRKMYKFIFHDDRLRDDERDSEEPYQRIPINDFYERIHSERPCKPYFDLECYVDLEDGDVKPEKETDDIVRTFLAKFITVLKDVINSESGERYECRTKSIALMTSCGVDGKRYKYSYHVIVRDLLVKNYMHAKELHHRVMDVLNADETIANNPPFLYDKDKCIIDSGVYSPGRVFRLFGCEKTGSRRVKNSYDEKGVFLIPYYRNDEVKTLTYRPSTYVKSYSPDWGKDTPDDVDIDHYNCFMDSLISPYGFHTNCITLPDIFHPDPTRVSGVRNRKNNSNVDFERAYELFRDLHDHEAIISGEPDCKGRINGVEGRICVCSGIEHGGTNGYYFDSHGSRRGTRYFIRCMSDSCMGFVDGEYDESRKQYYGLCYLGDPEKEKLVDEDMDVGCSDIKTENDSLIEAVYCKGDGPKYVGRESYLAFRDEENDKGVDIESLTISSASNIADVADYKSGVKSVYEKLNSLGKKLTTNYKIRKCKLSMWNGLEWVKQPRVGKIDFSFTINGEEKLNKIPVFPISILDGTYFSQYPFNAYPEMVGEYRYKWSLLKTYANGKPCTLNFFKGQPVPLTNKASINVSEGFQAVPNMKGDFSLLKPFFELWRVGLCSGNTDHYKLLKAVVGYIITNTNNPQTGIAICMKGPQGGGKSKCFVDPLQNIFGPGGAQLISVGDLGAKFNSIIEGKVFLYVEEPEDASDFDKKNHIKLVKHLVDNALLNIEGKGLHKKTVVNVANLFSFSNEWTTSYIDKKDERRFWFILSSLVGMLSNGTKIVANNEKYNGATYFDGSPLSEEDLALLKGEKRCIIRKRYFHDLQEKVNYKSQEFANLLAGYFISKYTGITKNDFHDQDEDDPVRVEAFGGLSGQAQKFNTALTSRDYTWYSSTPPVKMDSDVVYINGSYHVPNIVLYEEFRAWYRATSNGHCYGYDRFVEDFKSTVRTGGRIIICDRKKGADNRVTVHGKKVTVGFYIHFRKGFVLREVPKVISKKNSNSAAHELNQNKSGDDYSAGAMVKTLEKKLEKKNKEIAEQKTRIERLEADMDMFRKLLHTNQ